MKKWLGLTFLPWLVWGQEPANLADFKQTMEAYYSSNQQPSAYEQDTAQVVQQAKSYLRQRLKNTSAAQQAKMAVVFDIDDTLLWRYPYNKSVSYVYQPAAFEKHQMEDIDPLVPHIKELYDEALSHHLPIFLITAGCQHVIAKESLNLRQDGINQWQAIYAKPDAVCHDPHYTSKAFKTAQRRALEQQGYDIVLTVGDQTSDLGDYADQGFKLPNPVYRVN